jgi:hypothetical protein
MLGFIIPSRFEVDGADYDVAKFYILDYGDWFGNQRYYLDLWLVSEGVLVNASGEGVGTGDVIGLFLISSTPTLGEGTFTYVDDFEGEAGTTYGGRVYIGADYNASTADANLPINSGLVEVRKSARGDDYIISFEGTVDSGAAVTARYRGPLEAVRDVEPTEGPGL